MNIQIADEPSDRRLAASPITLFGWALLIAGLGFASFSAFTAETTPLGTGEVTVRLQAESLIRDFDLVFDEPDSERFRSKKWPADSKVELALRDDQLRFYRPLPYALAAAPFVRFGRERGPLLFNLFLLTLAAALLSVYLAREGNTHAPLWAFAFLFGTPLFVYVRSAWPELFVGVLLAGAYLLTQWNSASTGELSDMYRAPANASGTALRWLLVGVLVGLAVAQEPYLLPLVPAFGFVRRDLDLAASALPGLIGFSVVILVIWFVAAGLAPGGSSLVPEPSIGVHAEDSVTEIREWASLAQGVEARGFEWGKGVSAWNFVYVLAGRHSGLLVFFLPVVLFAFSGGRLTKPLWLGALGTVVLLVLLEPFNVLGGPEALGSRRLLPLVPVLGLAVRGPTRAWSVSAALVLSGVMLSPLWLTATAHPAVLRQAAVLPLASPFLPFETTQRYVPASGEVVTRDAFVRAANAGVQPGGGRSHFVLLAGKTGEIMVATAAPLTTLDIEFVGDPGNKLVVDGGEVRDLMFRPDGGVTFRVEPDQTRIHHRLWFNQRDYEIRSIRFTAPKSLSSDLPFSLSTRLAQAAGTERN